MKKHYKVVLLTANKNHHRRTINILSSRLEHAELAAVIQIDDKLKVGNLAYLKSVFRKQGLFKGVGTILSFGMFKLLFRYSEEDMNIQTSANIIKVDSYSSVLSLNALAEIEPDFIIVHSPYWVGPKVRAMARIACVGAHPGLTKYHRGVHSAFWARMHGEHDLIGYTVFHLSKKVDAGMIIKEEQISFDRKTRLLDINSLLMAESYKTIVNLLNDDSIPKDIGEHNLGIEYGYPGVVDILKYFLKLYR